MNEKLAASLILLRVALLLGLSVDKGVFMLGGGGGLATATAATSGSSLSEKHKHTDRACERQERCKRKCDVLIKMYFCSFLL